MTLATLCIVKAADDPVLPHTAEHRHPGRCAQPTALPIHGLQTISVVFWFVTIVLLVAMLAVFFLRLLASTRVVARSIATDTTEAACTASISISIAFMSCLQMLSLVVMPSWGGKGWSLAVYILRWMNCALTVLACIGLLDMFVMSIRSEGGLAGSLTGGATPSHHGADVGRRRRDALPVRRAERRAESADDVRGTHRDWTGVANGPGVRCAVSGQVAPAVGGTRGLASRVSPGADVLAHGAVRALGTE